MITLFSYSTSTKPGSEVLISEQNIHPFYPCTHDLAPSHGHCGMKIELDMDFITENKFM